MSMKKMILVVLQGKKTKKVVTVHIGDSTIIKMNCKGVRIILYFSRFSDKINSTAKLSKKLELDHNINISKENKYFERSSNNFFLNGTKITTWISQASTTGLGRNFLVYFAKGRLGAFVKKFNLLSIV